MAQRPKDDPYRTQRDLIDRIDRELVELLNRRAAAALEIGRLKRMNGEPIHVPEREQAVMEGVLRRNKGPLPAEAIEAVFRTIIARMRALEESGESGESGKNVESEGGGPAGPG
jgi:chorismate mutase/prephenate dehydratase